MKLQELLKGVAVLSSTADGEAEIGEVRYDSRAVGKGDLFVAIRGYATDGHKYIEKALEQGAAAVVCEEAPEGVPAVVVENSRKALAEIAANRFGHPADSMVMLGVTGTNGKTTTTYLVKHMLEDAGHKVGLIGTNQNLIGSEVIETERTTPESYELHALFARMRDAGCTHVIMEVSSHSLVLDRVHGIRFAVGAFTNLTQDHLDFHKTMEEYRKAKALLERVNKIAQGAALMTETSVSMRQIDGTASILPNETLERVMYENMQQVPVPEYTAAEREFAEALHATYPAAVPGLLSNFNRQVWTYANKMTDGGKRAINDFIMPYVPYFAYAPGSTDVGDVSWLTPTAQITTATWTSASPGHSWQNVSIGRTSIAHKGVLQAAKIIAGSAADLMEQPELLEKARAEFDEAAAEGYDCPIGKEVTY